MFEIIDGGISKTPDEEKKDVGEQIEQLKLFVSHMRQIENSITSVQRIAVGMEWHELNIKLISCHKHILDTLSFVKSSTKMKKIDKEKLTNIKKDHLTIL